MYYATSLSLYSFNKQFEKYNLKNQHSFYRKAVRKFMIQNNIDINNYIDYESYNIVVELNNLFLSGIYECPPLVINKGKEEAYGNKERIFKEPPTVESAKITGCKNIVQANQIDMNCYFVKEWNKKIKVKENRVGGSYIGIRANNITMAPVSEKENCILSVLSYISESPFRVTLFLSPVDAENSTTTIQCEMSKKEWNQIKNEEKIY